MKAGLLGLGTALPSRVIPNEEWAQKLDTSDAWIVRRTGIHERRWLAEGETLVDIGSHAAQAALADAGRSAGEVDLVMVPTATPDDVTPGVAPQIAARIGADRAGAIDLNGACAGFLYALDQAAGLIESGRKELILICAAEALSRITDQTDRGSAVLFGDGSGAVVVGRIEAGRGVGSFVVGADGAQRDKLYADGTDRLVRMEGPEVYRHAVARMGEATRAALDRAGLQPDDLDLLVAHQANQRIIATVAAELGLPEEKVVYAMEKVANTSAASIPLALAQAERDGRLEPGMVLGLAAFGAGFVWGAGVVGWKEPAGA